MRRGVWIVLALMGGVPAGAMAQQQRQADLGQVGTATQGNKPAWSCSAIGGSGRGPRPQVSAGRPGEQIFVGRLRSVTGDRLVMVDPSNRVYEFGVGAQTRIIGPRGEARLPQALKEGTPVRAVTREADVRNEVRFLQLLGPAPAR